MTTLQTVLRQLQSCAGHHHAGVKDGQLLEQFVRLQDEAAFAALVQRHGRMVYGVCLRLLRNTHDVEDAFQATFMVLARRATAILPRDNVGNWLHGVAYRTALKARMLMARRGKQQREFLTRTVEASTEEKIWEGVLPLLDQELGNLPENYRIPIVLCDLEGNSRRDAARQLGWPEGTVAGRLARGRSLLAKRLARRGVSPCAALFSGALLARRCAAACVPPKLMKATIQTALAYAASWPANGLVSARLAALSQGVFRTMLISQLQKTVALLLAAALVLSAAGWGARQVFAAVVTVDEPHPAEAPSALPQSQKAAPVQPAADEALRLGSTRFRHGAIVFFVAYVADGKRLITAAHDMTIRLWDAESGQEIRRFERPAEAAKATAMSMSVRTIGGAMGQTLDGLPQAAFPIGVSPDGQYLAASAGSTIQIWQVDSGKQLHALKLPAPNGGRINFVSQVRSLAFSSDGKKLLAGLASGPVAAWDLVSGKAEATKEAGQKTAPSGTTVVSPDGKYAAWCELNLMQQSTAIKVKDLTSGQEVADIKGAAGDGKHLTFTPDGKTLVWTQRVAGIQLLEIGKDAEPRTLGKVEQRIRPITSVNFAPDGQTVALSTAERTIELWDLKTGKLLREFGDAEPGGGGSQFIIVGVGDTNIRMEDVAFSKDGKTVAAALGGNFVRQFDLVNGKEIVTAEPGHRLPVGNVQLSPDGTMLTTAAARDSVRLWDLAQAKEIKKIPLTAQHGAVALSADGRRVYAAKGGTVEIWDVMTGERTGEVKAGNILIAALAVSPNGKTLAVRSAQGGAIQLWDTATGKKTGVLADQVPETGGIRAVMVGLGQASGVATAEIVFSPDGRSIAGASANRHLSLWDVSTGASVGNGGAGRGALCLCRRRPHARSLEPGRHRDARRGVHRTGAGHAGPG